MKLECKLENMWYDFAQKGTKFEFFVQGNILPSLEDYLNKDVNLELKKGGKKTLDENGYFWVLINELQKKLKIPKEDIYRKYIRECGVYQVLPVKNEAVDRFINDIWSNYGLGWVCDTTPSKIDGYTNVIAYYGISAYTKEEMATMLDHVVQDCIELGIPTKKKEEIESLLKERK